MRATCAFFQVDLIGPPIVFYGVGLLKTDGWGSDEMTVGWKWTSSREEAAVSVSLHSGPAPSERDLKLNMVGHDEHSVYWHWM